MTSHLKNNKLFKLETRTLQIKKYKKLRHLVKETITLFFGYYPLVVKFYASLIIVQFQKICIPISKEEGVSKAKLFKGKLMELN